MKNAEVAFFIVIIQGIAQNYSISILISMQLTINDDTLNPILI